MFQYIAEAFEPDNLSSWVSALFTLAAVVVALRVASASARREMRQGKSKATLMAARIAPLLAKDAWSIASAANEMEFMMKERTSKERVSCIHEALRRLTFTPDDAVLLALIPLERDCAHKISRAYGLLSCIGIEIGAQTGAYGLLLDIVISQWEQSFIEASRLLRDAEEICQASGHVAPITQLRSVIHTATMSRGMDT